MKLQPLKISCISPRKGTALLLNLIRKDIVLLKKTMLVLLAILCVYLILDFSIIWVGILCSIVISMQSFTLDEKSTIHLLLNSLPYTRKEIVSSKYIVAVLLTLLIGTVTYVGNIIIHGEMTSWKELLFMVAVVMVILSFVYPFCYKFKSNYLMIAAIGLIALYLLTVTFFIKDLHDRIRAFVNLFLTFNTSVAYLVIGILVIFLYIGSGVLSTRIYRKKLL
ncbi:ABC-2 transporter permease [Bacillus sp. RAR_GA_16]|uniref:ABC-2 transporter permease n=1 Tax=Bacillus sp. RAR_GA_16 TaxID=2876774 RepID=UPI001CCDD609|nr:ABC-2 transporter permease [Bacillus sp. RAR_GA_16]MCA0172918.1 ABC-2 transporter permease [Bacillus sp. RAR_GA_16]